MRTGKLNIMAFTLALGVTLAFSGCGDNSGGQSDNTVSGTAEVLDNYEAVLDEVVDGTNNEADTEADGGTAETAAYEETEASEEEGAPIPEEWHRELV